MSEGTISPAAAYMLRVAADEIEHLEDQNLLQFPHIARFIQRPATRFVLGHLQNFCWTTERTLGRIRRRPVPPQAIMPQWMRAGGTAPPPPARSCIAGIGRVALQLAKAGLETGLATPVFLEDGRVRPYARDPGRPDELQFGPDIVYVVLDSFWEQIGEYVAVCDRAKAAGARVVTCMHDVIPLYYPSFNRRRFAAAFAASFAEMMKRSDACITVSRYTATKVEAFVDAIGYFRNGDSSDLAARIAEAVQRRPAVSRFDIPTWKESLARMVEAIGVALVEPAWASPVPAVASRPRSIPFDAALRTTSRRQGPYRFRTNDLRCC